MVSCIYFFFACQDTLVDGVPLSVCHQDFHILKDVAPLVIRQTLCEIFLNIIIILEFIKFLLSLLQGILQITESLFESFHLHLVSIFEILHR